MARRRGRNVSRKVPVKPLVSFVLVLAITGFLLSALKIFFSRYPYFNISKISVEGLEDRNQDIYRQFIGKNIFSISLNDIRKEVEPATADAEFISCQRKFPSEIKLVFRKRIAIAQLKLKRYYPIDHSCFIMGDASDVAFADLPVIYGLDDKIEKPRSSQPCLLPELKSAVELIEKKERSEFLDKYRITRIDLGKQKNRSFFIAERLTQEDLVKSGAPVLEVEVKFEPQRASEALKVLELILRKRNGLLGTIEYIDIINPASPIILEAGKLGRGRK